MPITPPDIVAGTWVARFRSIHDERPKLGLVRDAYDGNLNITCYSPDGRSLGQLLVVSSGLGEDSPLAWEPIDRPDFQRLALLFSYGTCLVRRRSSGARPSNVLIQGSRRAP